jgi:transcriptional regulator with PAS, ATPase and Fis domain
MENQNWVKEFPGAITVCDTSGKIVEMNDQAIKSFQDEGGLELLGSNLLECHPEPARSKLRELMNKQQINVYTINKRNIRKLIYQTPWYLNGRYSGFMEIAIVIPDSIPHFNRD